VEQCILFRWQRYIEAVHEFRNQQQTCRYGRRNNTARKFIRPAKQCLQEFEFRLQQSLKPGSTESFAPAIQHSQSPIQCTKISQRRRKKKIAYVQRWTVSREARLLFIINAVRAQPPSAFWEQASETPFTW